MKNLGRQPQTFNISQTRRGALLERPHPNPDYAEAGDTEEVRVEVSTAGNVQFTVCWRGLTGSVVLPHNLTLTPNEARLLGETLVSHANVADLN